MPTDSQYLAQLQDYYARHRVLPSYSQIGKLTGLNSKASVAELVLRLKAEKYLQSTPQKRLKPGPRFFERPIAEGLRAGQPSPAAETGLDTLSIDEYLVHNPSKTVLIKVQGDSMVDAGIHPGDIVVVEKQRTAKVGDVVVAIVDGEFTLKTLGHERGRAVLQPANRTFRVIRPKGDLEIFGVVVGQFRRYR